MHTLGPVLGTGCAWQDGKIEKMARLRMNTLSDNLEVTPHSSQAGAALVNSLVCVCLGNFEEKHTLRGVLATELRDMGADLSAGAVKHWARAAKATIRTNLLISKSEVASGLIKGLMMNDEDGLLHLLSESPRCDSGQFQKEPT